MRTIAIINQKGGCGKTTTAINLAAVLASRHFRTLLVDVDPQSHCAAGLAVPEARIDLDITDALLAGDQPIDLQRLLWPAVRNLDLAPSRTRLAGLESPRGGLADAPDKELRLKHLLDTLAPRYDLCLIDCSPSIGLLTFNALAAADEVIVPVETSFFSLQGATKQLSTVRSMGRRLGREPRAWLLPTIHDVQSPHANDLLDELRRRFGARVLPVMVRRDLALKEAASFGQPIIEYDSESTGAEDYRALGDWLIANEAPTPLPDDDFLEPEPKVVIAEPPAQRATAIAGCAPPPVARVDSLERRREAAGWAAQHGLVGAEAEQLIEDLTFAPPGVVPESIRRLFGAHATRGRVLFLQPLSIGKRVAVAGDFNGWSDTPHEMTRNERFGVHELSVPAHEGRHLYRIVVDGHWTADHYNSDWELNSFGHPNSVVHMPAGLADDLGVESHPGSLAQ